MTSCGFVDAVALPTTVSKLHVGNGLVRISAGMVGILLNSRSPRELQRPTSESGVCPEGTTSQRFRTRLDFNKEINDNRWECNSGYEPEITRRDVSSEQVSGAKVASEPTRSSRYPVGLTPQMSRKTCAKCCWVLKPQATATSNTRASGARNIALARSSRWRSTN